jgi:hypothetical protein
MIHRALSLGVNQLEHKINKSLPPSTENNNEWTILHLLHLHATVLKERVALYLHYSQTIKYFVQVEVILLQIDITIWTGFGVQCTKVS